MTAQTTITINRLRLLSPDDFVDAAADDVAAAEVETGVVVTSAVVSCACAELIAPTAEPAAPIKLLSGLEVVVAACPSTPEACTSATATVKRTWDCIMILPATIKAF